MIGVDVSRVVGQSPESKETFYAKTEREKESFSEQKAEPKEKHEALPEGSPHNWILPTRYGRGDSRVISWEAIVGKYGRIKTVTRGHQGCSQG